MIFSQILIFMFWFPFFSIFTFFRSDDSRNDIDILDFSFFSPILKLFFNIVENGWTGSSPKKHFSVFDWFVHILKREQKQLYSSAS